MFIDPGNSLLPRSPFMGGRTSRSSYLAKCALGAEDPRSLGEFHRFIDFAWKPICLRLGLGGFISCRIASNTTLNWRSYFRSSSSNFFARSALEDSIWRSRTNVRMISTLTEIARWLRSTLDSIATPCSVKAIGGCRRPFRIGIGDHKL